MRKPLVIASLALLSAFAAPPAAHAASPAPAQAPQGIVAGRYVLRLHATNVKGVKVTTSKDKYFPIVIVQNGQTVGIGGKNAPQSIGSLAGSSFTSHRTGPASLGGIDLHGTLASSTSLQGTFTITTPKGTGISGNFSISSYQPGNWNGGSGSIGQTTPGSTMNKQTSSPSRGNGTTPGMAGSGPNLTGTSVSGDASSKGNDNSNSSSSSGGFFQDFMNSLDWGSGKGGGSSTGSTSTKDTSTSTSDEGFFSGLWDEAKQEWNEAFNDSSNSSGSGSGTGTNTGKGNNSVDDRQTYGGNDKLNKGAINGGQDTPGKQTTGGQNAQGKSVAVGPNAGDNPFEVSKSDVLNTMHLINPASDPSRGGAIMH